MRGRGAGLEFPVTPSTTGVTQIGALIGKLDEEEDEAVESEGVNTHRAQSIRKQKIRQFQTISKPGNLILFSKRKE